MKNGLRTVVHPATHGAADVQQADAPKTRKRGLVIAVGALLALAAVVVVYGQLDSSSDQPSPQQVAEQYFAARNAYDAEAARELMADDAVLNDMPVIGIDQLEEGFDVLSIYGFSFDAVDCAPGGTSATSQVRCSYQMFTFLNEPVSYPPVAGAMDFEIVDGKIARLDNRFPYAQFSPNVFHPFASWVAAEHGDDSLRGLFDTLPSGTATPRLDEESRALARSLVAEYRGSNSE
jgi:hypothetical protein